MKVGIKLMMVEFRHTPLKRWWSVVAMAVVYGGLIGLFITDIGLEAPGKLNFVQGLLPLLLLIFYPALIIRGDAYRISDPYAKTPVPDIYVLLKLIAVKHREKALGSIFSAIVWVMFFNVFFILSICITLIIQSEFNWNGHYGDLISAWVMLTGISTVSYIISEARLVNQIKMKDTIRTFLLIGGLIGVLSIVGMGSDLWFFGIVYYFIYHYPFWTITGLLLLFILTIMATIKAFERTFTKVDYHV
ncbi:hypothetical protein [Shouchella patagoniensis]|uniref:hypothetical protein n=1 Tax=Shouchella patagoniensis TaxID=228576 RepID=UPI000995CEB8|nr:hypothetical protein [Shouchella patagoniensis]